MSTALKIPPLPDVRVEQRKIPVFRKTVEAWMIPVAEKAITNGLPINLVAGLLGTTSRQLKKWRDAGSEDGCPDPLLVEFAVRVEESRSRAAQSGVELLQQHALTDWKAAKALLEAQDPETWGTKTQTQMNVHVEPTNPSRDLSVLTELELEQLTILENKILPRGI